MIREQLVGDPARLEESWDDMLAGKLAAVGRAAERGCELEELAGTARRGLRMVNNRYSAGLEVEEVARLFEDVPRLFAITTYRGFRPAEYGSPLIELLDVASLVALFEHRQGAEYVAEIVHDKGVEDFFIDSFVGSLIPFREPSDSIQMETNRKALGVKSRPLYTGLREAADLALAGEHADASKRLAKYVSGEWFGRHKSAFDWNVPGRGFYDGHWCFVGAAVAKVFDINDSKLQGHKYYPGDLVRR